MPHRSSPVSGFILLCCLLLCLAPAVRAEEPTGPESTTTPLPLTIVGIEGEMLHNVEAALALPASFTAGKEIPLAWQRRFVRQIPAKVQAALQPFGYYSAKVEVEGAPGKGPVRVVVHPGEPVRVHSLRLQLTGPGAQERKLRELQRQFPLVEGLPLRQDHYEAAKGQWRARAVGLGYLDAAFSRHEIRVDPQRGTADIDLTLDTGPRYFFGATVWSGAPDYPREYLRRFLAHHEGGVFSYDELGQTQLNLLGTGRFLDAIVQPQVEQARQAGSTVVPITIQLTQAKPKRLRPGIGYGTDTGARLSLQYSDLNVAHRGQEISADLVLAQVRQSLEASYILPDHRNANSQTAFRLGIKRETPDTYDSRTLSAEVERLRGLSRGRRISVYLRLLQEDYRIAGDSSRSQLVLPGLRYSQRHDDGRIQFPTGYAYTLELRGCHTALLSDIGLLQVLASGHTRLPLPLPGRFSLLLRLDTAASFQQEPFREIPASLRFFAGGDTSVRGYGYKTLGTQNAAGEVIGGKNLLVGSIELEHALSDSWGVALFFDAGNAFNNFGNIDFAKGVGIGGRWFSPIGPVRIDLAQRIDTDNPGYRLHLSVGYTF